MTSRRRGSAFPRAAGRCLAPSFARMGPKRRGARAGSPGMQGRIRRVPVVPCGARVAAARHRAAAGTRTLAGRRGRGTSSRRIGNRTRMAALSHHIALRRLAAGLAALLLAAPPLAAQQPPAALPPLREITVQNETEQALRALHAGPPGAALGPDRLEGEAIPAGATRRVRLYRTRDCQLDVTLAWQDGTDEVRRRVDVCRGTRLVLGDPALPRIDAAIANRSRVTLRELYAAPVATRAARAQDEAAWGPDRLFEALLEPGAEARFVLRGRACRFDLRAVYADEREELREDVDLCAAPAQAFDRSGIPRRALVVANRHLAPLQSVFLSPSTDNDWGPDRLEAAPLAVGAEATVTMEGPCEADLRIVFPNGGAEERRGIDVCAAPRLVLRPGWVLLDLEEAEPPAQGGAPAGLRLRNLGTLPVVELYVGPPDRGRGEDRLGLDVLPVGEAIELLPADGGGCAADLVAVFRDGREVTRQGLDLCAGEEVELR